MNFFTSSSSLIRLWVHMSSSTSSLYSIYSLEISGNPKSCIERPWSGHVLLINFNAFLSEVISCICGFIKYNLYLLHNSGALQNQNETKKLKCLWKLTIYCFS